MQDWKFELWPWEVEGVSRAEYNSTLDSLKRFLKIADADQFQVFALEDVSALASLVGHDLCVIAMAKGGESQERSWIINAGMNDPLSGLQRIYTFRMFQNNREMSVIVKDGLSTLSKSAVVGLQSYQPEDMRVVLPADRDIAIGNVPNVDVESIYAMHVQGVKREKFLPAAEPYNVEIQRGFMHILRECVEDLVRALLADSPGSPGKGQL
ncbi:MAG TPA: hypothetical protein VKV40_24700 [Ktedonobacteraceae bacterium]|nr:hypothetical protein [Ktedonobacteraceae bacterium]